MTSNVHNLCEANRPFGEESFLTADTDNNSPVQAKLNELQAWTISYNRELLRLTREINDLRAKEAKAA